MFIIPHVEQQRMPMPTTETEMRLHLRSHHSFSRLTLDPFEIHAECHKYESPEHDHPKGPHKHERR